MVNISIAQQRVVQTWNLTALKTTELARGGLNSDEVLNGIAADGKTMLVTGKYWRCFFASQFRY